MDHPGCSRCVSQTGKHARRRDWCLSNNPLRHQMSSVPSALRHWAPESMLSAPSSSFPHLKTASIRVSFVGLFPSLLRRHQSVSICRIWASCKSEILTRVIGGVDWKRKTWKWRTSARDTKMELVRVVKSVNVGNSRKTMLNHITASTTSCQRTGLWIRYSVPS